MKTTHTLRNLLLLTGSSMLAASSASAANIWDGGGGDANWNTATNWDNNAVPAANATLTFTGIVQPSTNNNTAADRQYNGFLFTNDGSTNKDAVFTLAGNRITLGGNITTTANTTGSTITDVISLNMILNGDRTITTNQLSDTVQHNLTINGVISQSGTRGIIKAGGGTLTLGNANTYTGTTRVDAGELRWGVDNAISSGALTINGGTANIQGFNDTVGAVTLTNGTITGTSGVLTGTSYSVLNGEVSAILAGAGALTKSTTGTVTLTKANTYTGATIINAGTLDLGGGTAGGSLDSTVLTLGGGSLSYTRTGTNTQSFTTTNLNATGTLSVSAGNTLNLGTINRTAGSTLDFASAGIIAADLSNNDATGIMAGMTVGDSWAVANGAGIDISAFNSYTLSSVAGTTGSNYNGNHIDVDSSEGVLDAAMTANSLRFSEADANTLTLTGTNTITTGGILVGSGVGANLSTITGGTLRGASNKDLVIIQNNTSGGLTIASDIVNNGTTSVTKSGAGLLTLSGNNTFTGGLVINAGEVALGSAGALNSTAGSENAVTFGAGSTGTLSLNGNDVVLRSLTSNANNPGLDIVQNASAGAATLTIGNSANQSSTFTGTIQDGTGGGALTLIKAGTGTLNLSNTTNTYSGDTVLTAGQLTINSDANLGATTGDIIFSGNSTLRIENVNTINADRTITINDGVTGTFTSTNNAKTFQGSLEGSGTLFVNHSTSFIFENASNFTGAIRANTANSSGYGLDMYTLRDEVGDGTITLENGSFRWFGSGGTKTFDDRQFFLGSSSGGSIYNRSTDNSALVITTNLGQSGTGARTLTLGGNNSAAGTFAGNIGDNGSNAVTLTKTEGNVWALGGTNTYSGNTNLSASGTTGRLIFQGSQALSPNTKLVFAQASSSVQSVSFLDDGAGTINFNRPIEFGGSNTSQNLNIFVGNNHTDNGGSSSGTTTDSTIQVGDITFTSVAGDTNTTRINVTGANGYRLQTGTITLNNLVSRTAGSTTVTELNPTGANMTVAAITMAAGNAGPGADGVPLLRLDGTTTDNRVTGAISESSVALSLEKEDSSTWTLSGASSYTGTTAIRAGRLIAGTNSLASTDGAFGNAASEITLGVAGGNNAAGILTGGAYNIGRDIRLLTNNTTDTGSRVLTIGGNTAHDSEFSGNIILGTASQAGRGVTLTAADGGQVTFSGAIQDPSSMDATTYTVTKSGLGTVILATTNTYTGATNVTEGTLLINGSGSTSASSAVTVSGGAIGGTGSILSTLSLSAGSFHVVDLFDALQVAGTVSIYSGFGVDNLVGLDWSTVNAGTYTLIDGTLDTGVFDLLNHNSSDTSYDAGFGRTAYFQEGSLQLVVDVIPEPSVALLGGLGLLVLFRRRRA